MPLIRILKHEMRKFTVAAGLLIWFGMLAFLVAADAPKPIKLSEPEYHTLRDLQVKIQNLQLQMKANDETYRNAQLQLQQQIQNLGALYDKSLGEARKQHNCADCDLDENADLVHKPAEPKKEDEPKKP